MSFGAKAAPSVGGRGSAVSEGGGGAVGKAAGAGSLQSSALDVAKSVGENSATAGAPSASFRTVAAGAGGPRGKGGWEMATPPGKATRSPQRGEVENSVGCSGNNSNFTSPLQGVLALATDSKVRNRYDGRNPLGDGVASGGGVRPSDSCRLGFSGDGKTENGDGIVHCVPFGGPMGRSEFGNAKGGWSPQSPRDCWPQPAFSGKSSPHFGATPAPVCNHFSLPPSVVTSGLRTNNVLSGASRGQLHNADAHAEDTRARNNSFASTTNASFSRYDNKDSALLECEAAEVFTPKRKGRDSVTGVPSLWCNSSFHGSTTGGPRRRLSTMEQSRWLPTGEQAVERGRSPPRASNFSPAGGITENNDASFYSRTGHGSKDQRRLSCSAQPACFSPAGCNACASEEFGGGNARECGGAPSTFSVPVAAAPPKGETDAAVHVSRWSPPGHRTERTNSEWWFKDPTIFLLNVSLIRLFQLKDEIESFGAGRGSDQRQFMCEKGEREGLAHMTHSVTLDNMLEQLEFIQFQIAYAILDIRNVLLKRLFTKWSNEVVRNSVSTVALTWEACGPDSTEFKDATLLLLNAVSSEQPGSITYTRTFRMWNSIGPGRCAWGVAIASCVIALLCFVAVAFGDALPSVVSTAVAYGGVVLMISLTVVISVLSNYSSVSAGVWRFSHGEMLRRVLAVQENLYDESEETAGVPIDYGGIVAVHRISGSSSTCQQVSAGNIQGCTSPRIDPAQVEWHRDCGPLSSRSSPYSRNQLKVPNDTTGILRKVPSTSNVKGSPSMTTGAASPGRSERPIGAVSDAPSCRRRTERHEDEWHNPQPGGRWNGNASNYGSSMERVTPGHTPNPLTAVEPARELYDVFSEPNREHDGLVQKQLGRPAYDYESSWGDDKTRQPCSAQHSVSKGMDGGAEVNSSPSGANDSVPEPQSPGSSLLLTSSAVLLNSLVVTGLDGLPMAALVYCLDRAVMNEVLTTLWGRCIYVMHQNTLEDLIAAHNACALHTKVVLLHAPDMDAAQLGVTLSWLKEGKPTVFFLASSAKSIPSSVPKALHLLLPLTPQSIETILAPSLTDEAASRSLYSLSRHLVIPSYSLGRRLGGGAFGSVFEATMHDVKGRCAVKTMYLQAGKRGNGERNGGHAVRMSEVVREIEVMQQLNHPNIVRYLFCSWDGECVSIFMELCPDGTLSDVIANGDIRGADHLISIIRDIISGVLYLHERRVTHRDLKPENILFRDGRAKVSDFGTAVQRDSGLKNTRGTLAYMAPEVLLGESYGKSCDVWSIGCIVAEAVGVPPVYRSKGAVEVVSPQKQRRTGTDQQGPQPSQGLAELYDRYRMMGKNETPTFECDQPVVCDFLRRCLNRNPAKRSNLRELLEHSLLNARQGSPVWEWLEAVTAHHRTVPPRRKTSTVILTSVAVNKGGGAERGENGDDSAAGEGGLCTTYVSRMASVTDASLQSISGDGANSASWGSRGDDPRDL